jgi:hypothetical protein
MYNKFTGHSFFFTEFAISAIVYLNMMELYAAPQPWIVLQEDGAPPHWELLGRQFLDATFPNRWIGRDGPTPRPSRSPDSTLLDFLWVYVKDKLYSTPFPDIDTLKARIREALAAVTEEMLGKTWTEIEYKLNILSTTNGAHVEVY